MRKSIPVLLSAFLLASIACQSSNPATVAAQVAEEATPLSVPSPAFSLGEEPRPTGTSTSHLPVITVPTQPTPTPVPTATSVPLPTPRPTSAPTQAPLPTVAPTPSPSYGFDKGVNYLMYAANDPFMAAKIGGSLDYHKGLGINSIMLVIPIHQPGCFSNVVMRDANKAPPDHIIATFFQEAHLRGLKVVFRPIVDEGPLKTDGKPDCWRGIIPATDRDQWFRTYTETMVSYARIAQQYGVDTFSVGAEFESLEVETERWRQVIAAIRSVFSGKILYCLNWGSTRDGRPLPTFLQYVDIVGIDAFFDLDRNRQRLPAQPTVAQLVDQWIFEWGNLLYSLKAHFAPKPVVITELGVVSRQESFRIPALWSEQTNLPIDIGIQARYYAASCQVMRHMIGFNGIYWWNTGLYPPGNPFLDPNFTFQGKPAEMEVRNCFSN